MNIARNGPLDPMKSKDKEGRRKKVKIGWPYSGFCELNFEWIELWLQRLKIEERKA